MQHSYNRLYNRLGSRGQRRRSGSSERENITCTSVFSSSWSPSAFPAAFHGVRSMEKTMSDVKLIFSMSQWKTTTWKTLSPFTWTYHQARAKKSQVKVNVPSCLMKLELLITHHPSTSDVKKAQDSLNIKGFKYDKSHPKILGFHEYFKQFRVRDLEPIFSRSVIDLPFAVKKRSQTTTGRKIKMDVFHGHRLSR